MKATNIIWDVDFEEDLASLPTEVQIPAGMEDEDEISDYLSDLTGYCHKGFELIDEAISINKFDILREIRNLVKDELVEPGDSIGYTMPDGKYHIFIELEDIGNLMHGEDLVYRIEPNVLDEDGAAEPMEGVHTADFGDHAELLLGCVRCMDLFDADLAKKQERAGNNRVEVDLGYATLVAEKGTNPDYNEVYVGLEGKDGRWIQDLTIVGGQYHYSTTGDIAQDNGVFVKVYADKDTEDFTHEFSVGVYESEEAVGYDALKIEASLAHIDFNKLQEYLNEEMILEFDSEKECMDYFNLHDDQNFRSVEEMKAYQGEYGFGLNGKWYHISFDEALDVRTNLAWIRQNAAGAREDTISRYMVNVIDRDDGHGEKVFVYADSECEMREKLAEKYDSVKWAIGGWEVQNVPARYKEWDEGIGQAPHREKNTRPTLDDKIKEARIQSARENSQDSGKETSRDNAKE